MGFEIEGLDGKWVAGDESITMPIEVSAPADDGGTWIACYDGCPDEEFDSLDALMRAHTLAGAFRIEEWTQGGWRREASGDTWECESLAIAACEKLASRDLTGAFRVVEA